MEHDEKNLLFMTMLYYFFRIFVAKISININLSYVKSP